MNKLLVEAPQNMTSMWNVARVAVLTNHLADRWNPNGTGLLTLRTELPSRLLGKLMIESDERRDSHRLINS
jgi:hypothetical protein